MIYIVQAPDRSQLRYRALEDIGPEAIGVIYQERGSWHVAIVLPRRGLPSWPREHGYTTAPARRV